MFMVIPTWRVKVVSLSDTPTFRVPETNLDQFLHVLTFNKMEFQVVRERDPNETASRVSGSLFLLRYRGLT